MFKDPQFYLALKNTLGMSVLILIVNFTFPVALAILFSELRAQRFQKVVQTISYLPHFVSWVIVAGIVTNMLSSDGFINQMLVNMGLIEAPIQFMAKQSYFWGIVTMSDLWKELGWNSIIFLAAIAGIGPELYEAAAIDGATKFKRIMYITVPSILPTVMFMLIMSIGNIINIGFERQMLLSNSLVSESAQVLDMYILDYGIRSGRYAFGTAVGMFKSVVGIIMVFGANKISKKTTGVKMV